MAKIAYTKFACKANTTIKTITFNNNNIEIKQYLPIDEKLGLIGRVIDLAHDQDYNYSNPVKRRVYTDLEILMTYTNISFTEKQKEDTPKLYDQVYCSGLLNEVLSNIPEDEVKAIYDGVENTIGGIYEYQHSALGILNVLKEDYSAVDEEAGELQKKLANPENLELLRNILTKLG